MQDISFIIEDIKFNYRVAIIIENKDQVLLQKSEKDSYWSLIGGRVKIGESTINALVREVEEEIGIKIDKKQAKVIHIAENFFEFNKKKFHEILFIFKLKITDSKLIENQDFKVIDKSDVLLHWFNKTEVNDLNLQPTSAKQIINNDTLSHSIIID